MEKERRYMVPVTSEIDFTLDSAFKALFKSPEFRAYQAAVLADLLNLSYDYVYNNICYLDTEFIPDSKLKIKRSDVLIEIGKFVLILEMNRRNYTNLRASKLRYLAEVYNNVYFNKDGEYSKKEVILLNINSFDDKRKISEYLLQNKCYEEYCPGMKVLEISLANIKKKWYNKVILSKLEKRLGYIAMSKKSQEIINEYIKGDDVLMQTEMVKTKLKQPLVLNLDPEKEREYEMKCIKEDAIKSGLAKGMAKGIARGIAQGRAEGRNEGKESAKKEIAAKMKQSGTPLDDIVKWTGLTAKQINVL